MARAAPDGGDGVICPACGASVVLLIQGFDEGEACAACVTEAEYERYRRSAERQWWREREDRDG
jgi:hypothetical protein